VFIYRLLNGSTEFRKFSRELVSFRGQFFKRKERSMSSKARIMIVEDNIDESKLIKMALEPEGYEVITALNGKEAKEKIRAERPDFIVLDVMMPEMDGFAFCSWLRSDEKLKTIPVVLLTGVAEHIYESKYPLKGVMEADADDYLEKPVKPEVLLETISKLLKK
jgi:two-component system alkaline phosphatase synthesis response regulator PhoP